MGSDFTDHIAYSLPWDPINNPHVGQVLEYEFDQTWHDLRVANPLDFSLNTQHVQVNVSGPSTAWHVRRTGPATLPGT